MERMWLHNLDYIFNEYEAWPHALTSAAKHFKVKTHKLILFRGL